MSDTNNNSSPVPAPVDPLWKRILSRVSGRWVQYLILLAAGALLARLGVVLPPVPQPDGPIFFDGTKASEPVLVEEGVPYFGGWIEAPTEAERIRESLAFHWFEETPAGRAAGADGDVFLWQSALKVTGKNLAPRNQGDVGSCVAFGTSAAIDTLQLVQIAGGENLQYKPTVQEAVYALARVEIGGGQIRGDGAVGSWAAQAVKTGKYGVLPREQVLTYDLSIYSTVRCRDWGRRGLPDDLEPVARQSPVKNFTYCRSTAEIDRALSQGYPIAICSSLAVGRQRDANGFARPSGSWQHCMAILGMRQDVPGYFIWNSWGATYHMGPLGAGNPPEGGFWIRKEDLAPYLSRRNTECIAFSDAVGFPSRKLDWLLKNDQPQKGAEKWFASR